MITSLLRPGSKATYLFRHYSTTPGFAGISQLQKASDWTAFAADAVAKCDELVDRVITTPPSAATVRLLDDISDTICQVVDAAEFCRQVHSDATWRSAAERVCIDLGSYVQRLNTHYGLYTALAKALPSNPQTNNKNITATATATTANNTSTSLQDFPPGFDEETLLVGKMLLRDFERYGVHLSGEKRDRMNMLVAHAQALGMQLVQNVSDPHRCGELLLDTATHPPSTFRAISTLPLALRKSFQPLSSHTAAHIYNKQNTDNHTNTYKNIISANTYSNTNSNITNSGIRGVRAPAESGFLANLMRHSNDSDLRKAAYMAYNQHPVGNAELIDQVVAVRKETAELMGYPSYAHYQLDGFSLARCPEAVTSFLTTLSDAIRPACEAELEHLLNLQHSSHSTSTPFFSTKKWSTSALSHVSSSTSSSTSSGNGKVAPWDRGWLLGMGRSSLSSHLVALSSYLSVDSVVEGVGAMVQELMQVELREEVLSPGSNEGWAPGVQKLTAIHKEEGELGVVYLDLFQRRPKFPGAAHFVVRCGRQTSTANYQLPVVALVANLSGGPRDPLSHTDAETLCHEMGHALNSLLSRTKLQHLSGTRGPLDIVEIPSHVMEQYAWHPATLRMLCHPNTQSSHSNRKKLMVGGEGPPEELLQAVAREGRQFGALEVQHQIVFSALDQLLHGPTPPTGAAAVHTAIAEIMEQHSSFAHVPDTLPHLRFAHLIGYGATYYSYLFAQCISAELWRERLAAAGPLSQDTGALLRRALLEPGGAKEAGHYVRDLFDFSVSSGGGNMTTGRKKGQEGASASGDGVLVGAEGGLYPDPQGLISKLGIA